MIASPLNNWSEEQVSAIRSPEAMLGLLRSYGCSRCKLGEQPGLKGPVVFRGNPRSKYMLLGEGPGLNEDQDGFPFTGKAGLLLDRIFQTAGLDTKDWFLDNVEKCRPIAPSGSGKQNLTPTAECLQACKPFWLKEVALLQPSLLVCTGKVSASTVLETNKPMKDLAGHLFWKRLSERPTRVFVMYHPAAILHSEPYPDKFKELRDLTWLHIRQVRNLVESLEGRKEFYKVDPPKEII